MKPPKPEYRHVRLVDAEPVIALVTWCECGLIDNHEVLPDDEAEAELLYSDREWYATQHDLDYHGGEETAVVNIYDNAWRSRETGEIHLTRWRQIKYIPRNEARAYARRIESRG